MLSHYRGMADMGLSDYLGRFWYSSEPMFGVIMVICFTSILRTNAVFAEEALWRVVNAALACCIAWGLVDGIFYAWELHYDRRKIETLASLSKLPDGVESARSLLEEDLKGTVIGSLDDRDQQCLHNLLLVEDPAI